MKQILFLSVSELKDYSPIQTNLDEKILNQSILEYQEVELEFILGEPLYQRLSNELVNGATIEGYTYSTTDTLLFNKIRPVMIYGSLLMAINPLHFKITNKGVQKLNDANASIAPTNELETLRSSYTFKLDAYKKRLLKYIADLEEQTKEDEYKAVSDIDSTFEFSGIYIPDNYIDVEEFYKSQAYKTGYYRRIIF